MPSSPEKVKAWKATNKQRMHESYLRYRAKYPERFPAPAPKPLLTEDEKKRRRAVQAKEWLERNPEKALKSSRDYYSKNREPRLAKTREWKAANKEAVRENKRQWTAKHPGSNSKRSQRWAKNNPEKSAKSNVDSTSRWQKRNPEKTHVYRVRSHSKRRSSLEILGSFTAEEWALLLDRTGHKCLGCGIAEAESIYRYPRKGFALRGRLTVDHIIPLSRGGSGDIGNIAPLCLTCNMRKHAKLMGVSG